MNYWLKMSLAAKIIAGKSAAAVVSAVAVLVIILAACGGKTNPPDKDESTPGISSAAPSESDETSVPGSSQTGDNGMDDTDLPALIAKLPGQEALREMHSLFSGYWISGDLFVGFIYTDEQPAIYYGIYQSGFGDSGKIVNARAVSQREAELTIRIPAIPDDHMDGPQPERTETVYVDISNYNDNRLNIKIGNTGSSEWHTYEYGGGSLEDAFKDR